MKILVVRLSSLGDILHLFPAVSDLRSRFPKAEIHWLVEPAFAEMTGWHVAVDKVIAVPLRRNKKTWWKIPGLLRHLKKQLKAEHYDLVIDAQGLIKSAMLSRLPGIDVYGFSAGSAREPLAARFYKKTASVAPGLHVVEKNRQLIAKLFGADISGTADFGLAAFRERQMGLPEHLESFEGKKCILLLHGTTWNSKYWPEASWLELTDMLVRQGFRCLLPWGNEEEKLRAARLAKVGGEVLLRLSLDELACVLLHAGGFVSVETGIGHLATVLDVPGIMLHGPTDPGYSGILGGSCVHIKSGLDCSPCFKRHCPIPDQETGLPPCQQAIAADMVFDACLKLFYRNGS